MSRDTSARFNRRPSAPNATIGDVADYVLRSPVTAVRYAFRENEHEVMDLVAPTREPGSSFSNAHEPQHLHIFNGGPELYIRDRQWVVAFGRAISVLPDEDFDARFVAIDDDQ